VVFVWISTLFIKGGKGGRRGGGRGERKREKKKGRRGTLSCAGNDPYVITCFIHKGGRKEKKKKEGERTRGSATWVFS